MSIYYINRNLHIWPKMYPAFYRTPPQKKKPNYKYTVRIMMVILQISSEGETVTL